ncbi:MAG: tyrosine-type recombinase/integrase [Candidatus Acidiferrales bacterium]
MDLHQRRRETRRSLPSQIQIDCTSRRAEQCKTKIREGRYDNRHEVEVTCETRPVCAEHYLHRLRKTAATNWLRSGFDLMKIRSWLGHKSLEVTQIYLDAEMHDPEEQKKLDLAGKF